jgi:hypothetical protein
LPSPDDQIQLIQECLRAKLGAPGAAGHRLVENHDPTNEPYADYHVVHEIVVEPLSLDQLRIEFWVTDDGAVSVGLERRSRVAKFTGVKTSRDTFIAGHEPVFVSPEYVRQLVDLVANGAFEARGRVAFGRLTWVKLHTPSGTVLPPEVARRLHPIPLLVPIGRQFRFHYRPW